MLGDRPWSTEAVPGQAGWKLEGLPYTGDEHPEQTGIEQPQPAHAQLVIGAET